MLPVKLQESDLAVLGIIMDADTDLAARWQGLADRLSAAGYESVGSLPGPKGTVFIPPGNSLLPKLGIWLMPNNQVTGILEDFAFPGAADDALLAHAETEAIGHCYAQTL